MTPDWLNCEVAIVSSIIHGEVPVMYCNFTYKIIVQVNFEEGSCTIDLQYQEYFSVYCDVLPHTELQIEPVL